MLSPSCKETNQSILKEISPGCSLERMMLKLKLQYIGQDIGEELTHWKRLWCWERFGAGGGGGDDGGWDGWVASLTRWMWIWVNSGSCWWTGRPGVLRFMGSQRVGHNWATELNWTEGDLGSIYSSWPLGQPSVQASVISYLNDSIFTLCAFNGFSSLQSDCSKLKSDLAAFLPTSTSPNSSVCSHCPLTKIKIHDINHIVPAHFTNLHFRLLSSFCHPRTFAHASP